MTNDSNLFLYVAISVGLILSTGAFILSMLLYDKNSTSPKNKKIEIIWFVSIWLMVIFILAMAFVSDKDYSKLENQVIGNIAEELNAETKEVQVLKMPNENGYKMYKAKHENREYILKVDEVEVLEVKEIIPLKEDNNE